jgi:hypothetical protein
MRSRLAACSALFSVITILSGCHSAHIDATVENRTGAAIDLLEVDYPSASFGSDHMEADADLHYRFQVRLHGPMKVQYTEGATHTVFQMTGPDVSEGQEGQLVIVLLPGGKTEFHPTLRP